MIRRIISGGQTGVDQAALRCGLTLGLEVGGYCPRAFATEEGQAPVDLRPFLTPTESADPSVRTELNVLNSDATLIIAIGELFGGTKLTADLATRHRKAFLVVEPEGVEEARAWLGSNPDWKILNVAGPRESESPGIGHLAKELLLSALGPPK